VQISFYLNKYERFLRSLEKLLQRSGICIGTGYIYSSIRLTYEDVYGADHQRYFGRGVVLGKDTKNNLDPNVELNCSPILSVGGISSNSKDWNKKKELEQYIEKVSNAYIIDDRYLNVAVQEIVSKKSSLKNVLFK
jgi:hypothetical protein